MTQTAQQYFNEAQNAYDGRIPQDVMDTYENMLAIEEGRESPHIKQLKQQANQWIKMGDNAASAAPAWIKHNNYEEARKCISLATNYYDQADEILISLKWS